LQPFEGNLMTVSNLKSQNYAIIVAGGSGTRMGSDIPKQFLMLNGKPVLMHTLEAFYHTSVQPRLILVLAANYRSQWEQLCMEHSFYIPHDLVNGGESRFHSVKNALDIIDEFADTLVAIHDAVRPLVNKEIIEESFRHAGKHGNAITAVKSRDSVRQLKNKVSSSIDRNEIYLVQTPQTFKFSQLKKAYTQTYDSKFTDDASVVERAGMPINMVEGNYQNIKITFREDIAIAEAILNTRLGKWS